GLGEGACVWCTVPEGSDASVWLLLAAWQSKSELIVVEETPHAEARLELLHKLRPSAVWFGDDEYLALAEADVPPWIDLSSITRALVTGAGAGAAAFREI